MQGTVETEVKLRLSDPGSIERRLRQLGFGVAKERIFEANVLYDSSDGRLRTAEQILRLRQAGNSCKLTFKGAGKSGPHKVREELESGIDSFEMMERIFGRLGYAPAFRYEKYRTEWQRPGATDATVTVDETPIGWFLELEGPPEWIDQTAAGLGFVRSDYVLDSYGRLYLAECERRGVQPTNMVFAS